MTADNLESVLQDDQTETLMAGSLTLFVAFALTVWVIATTASPEVVLLAAVIWVLGSALRAVEVLRG